jgi:hypothetical protein
MASTTASKVWARPALPEYRTTNFPSSPLSRTNGFSAGGRGRTAAASPQLWTNVTRSAAARTPPAPSAMRGPSVITASQAACIRRVSQAIAR